jgi:hypothetical protein
VLVPQDAQHLHLGQLVDPGRGGVGVDRSQQGLTVRADLGGQRLGGGVLAAQQPGGLDLAAIALVPAFPQQGHDPAGADPGDLLQRGPQALTDGLDAVQPPHAGDHVGGVGALPPARLDQPGILQPLKHQTQHCIRPPTLDQAGTKLRQRRVIEAGGLQLQAQGVLPGDPVRDRLGGLPVGQVVPELQDRHHQQQRRRQPRLPARGVHVGELAGGEVHVAKQRAQRVTHSHLIRTPRMHLVGQRRRRRRDLWNVHGPQHGPSYTQEPSAIHTRQRPHSPMYTTTDFANRVIHSGSAALPTLS